MDDLRPITPIRRPLVDKRARVPPSKSVANRETVLSAIADGRSRLQLGPLDPGDDVRAMTEAVIALDYRVERDDGELVIQGTGAGPHRAGGAVDARDAGTVARFGVALGALGSGSVTITGSPRLRERPIAPLLDALRGLGATVTGDRLPVTIVGPIRGGEIEIAGNESSQFASALLLVAPPLEGGLTVRISGALVTVRRIGELHGVRANVRDCSDVFPTLAVVATQASEATELTGIGHTRKQESDRVSVVANGINALGGRAQAFADAIRVEPAPLHDGIVDACGDHRIAMAFPVLGLQVPGVAIKGSGSVAKTFPQFYELLAELSR